jgi:hypothetical protein
MHKRGGLPYRRRMQFSDSTFAALRVDSDSFDRWWIRRLVHAVVLTLAAASAGLLAGG